MKMSNHFFHLVNYSPWPITMTLNLVSLGMSVIILIMFKSSLTLCLATILICLTKFQWWRDITREALYEGAHTKMVKAGISLGVVSFIVSELCFFASFFWMYFYLSLSPDSVIGSMWPPKGIPKISYLDIPLLNTLILLSSGLFITWSHYSLMTNMTIMMKLTYLMAITMGIYFFLIQMYEYYKLPFDFSDSVFSSSFFILTGFHGFHVLVGIMFISINLMRINNNEFSMISYKGFEYSVWYWHFVDIIWLFLYISIYWWGM